MGWKFCHIYNCMWGRKEMSKQIVWQRRDGKENKLLDKNHHLPQVYQKCHLLLKPALFWQQMAFLSHSINPGKVREYPVASYFTCPEECPSSPLMEDSTSSRFPSMPQSRSHWVTVVHVLTRYPFKRGISVYAEFFLSFFCYLPVWVVCKNYRKQFCSFILIVSSLQMCRFWI